MNRNALRSEWEAYAYQHGLVKEPPQGMVKTAPVRKHGNKYGAIRDTVDGHTFDSRKESARYQELKLMQMAKQIADLELQPRFPLHVMRLCQSSAMPIAIVTVGMFRADFRYTDLQTGEIVVEDVKSDFTKNTAYKLRKLIAEAVHGIHVREL